MASSEIRDIFGVTERWGNWVSNPRCSANSLNDLPLGYDKNEREREREWKDEATLNDEFLRKFQVFKLLKFAFSLLIGIIKHLKLLSDN